jgi:hypothetical protein
MSEPQSKRSIEKSRNITKKELTLMMHQLRNFPTAFLVCLLSVSGLTRRPQKLEIHPNLMLECGSVLGLAHIGVIQFLEQHYIPVNYITPDRHDFLIRQLGCGDQTLTAAHVAPASLKG